MIIKCSKPVFFVYELDIWLQNLNTDLTLKDYLLGAGKLTKNVILDKYSYSGHGIGFDSCSLFLIQHFSLIKMFGVHNSS